MFTSKLLNRFVVIAAVGLMVAACTSAPASEPSSEAVIPDDELVEPGKLTIATTGSADPFTIINEDGDLVGYDIDVCTTIAERVGLEPNWVTIEWAGTLPGLKAGRFDMVCSGVGLTPERLTSTEFNMSVPTIQGGGSVYVRADDDRIQSWEDIDGMVMGSVRGAWYGPWVVENFANVEFVEYPGETELFLDLENERLDFIAFGSLGAGRLTESYDIRVAIPVFRPTPYGMALRKEARTLLREVNNLVWEFQENGDLEGWQTEWFGQSHLVGTE